MQPCKGLQTGYCGLSRQQWQRPANSILIREQWIRCRFTIYCQTVSSMGS
jgi:hypothetical protein